MSPQIDISLNRLISAEDYGQASVSIDLGSFRKNETIPGRGHVIQLLWAMVGLPVLHNAWVPGSRWRVTILRLFGAKIGSGVVIKPGVRVKFPWKLRIGDNSWIGEDCWIDNLAEVTLGSNVCLSQACYLCTGNHDWKDPSFSMTASPIVLEDGVWVASRSTLGPGVRLGRNAIAAMGSVVRSAIPAGEIHGGNPAQRQGMRILAQNSHVVRSI
ncbi:MAG: WcaF family extracellular polysaccharide biosynthesis acetyltransferase [Acidobacteriaceae bacterium]